MGMSSESDSSLFSKSCWMTDRNHVARFSKKNSKTKILKKFTCMQKIKQQTRKGTLIIW